MTSSPTTGTNPNSPIAPWDDSFADKGVMDAIAKARVGDEDAIYSLDILLKANPGSKWAGEAAEALAAVQSP